MALKYKTPCSVLKKKKRKTKNSSSDHYFVNNCSSQVEIKFDRCYLKNPLCYCAAQWEISVAINNSFTRCGLLNSTKVLQEMPLSVLLNFAYDSNCILEFN